jgi:hypothetical protein
LVVGRDADPGLLELAHVRRCRGPRVECSVTLLVGLLPQSAAMESVSRALLVGARYVEWVAVGVRLDLQVTR